jgi:hypothetical protein
LFLKHNNFFLADNVLNLLAIPLQRMDGAESDTQEHLVVIENINKFLEQRLGDKNGNRSRKKLCIKCLNFFKTEESLDRHKSVCQNRRGQIEIPPEKGESITFTKWNNKFEDSVVGFLDFETIQIQDRENPEIKRMKAYQYSLVFGNNTYETSE